MNGKHQPLSGFRPWFTPEADAPLGYVAPDVAALLIREKLLAETGESLWLAHKLPLTASLDACRASLLQHGLIDPPRGELMPVFAAPGEAMLATVDRSAMRILGLWAVKVHVNGLVWRPDAPRPDVWLSRRSLAAAASPGALDTFVAGGQPAGASLEETMIRESGEEVGVPRAQARKARLARQIPVTYASPNGLHREMLAIFDLDLPPDFRPTHPDGEIAESLLLSWAEFTGTTARPAGFKQSSLSVCRDLFARLGA